MRGKIKKLVMCIGITLILLALLIICDLKNVITHLGLSPTVWSTVFGTMVPIILTLYLWKKEEMNFHKELKIH